MKTAHYEPLPEAMERYHHVFGGDGGAFALVILPDSTSFLCRPGDDSDVMKAKHLTRAETLEKLVAIYGAKFRVVQ
ncbi:hypothetical protein CN198_14695 [Sinorhizobium meliloti]|uniref:hypothetical protein n=1 Tax=Rhizobium meliloti TaxID=382 RepID=UPI000FDBCBB5|nr:hypothetical protein [Sinorhizobium meliloti]MDW9936583.1 hypothetical protein [Sinorhizobium meliloti]MDX0395840.1 hypothetical protein [Sinorhizobium meliloti]RVH68900.1 hypothetical protein CN198_14695 [Sinorhizobium meliloti]